MQTRLGAGSATCASCGGGSALVQRERAEQRPKEQKHALRACLKSPQRQDRQEKLIGWTGDRRLIDRSFSMTRKCPRGDQKPRGDLQQQQPLGVNAAGTGSVARLQRKDQEIPGRGEALHLLRLTDGEPQDQGTVFDFPKQIVQAHRLGEGYRDELAAKFI